MCCWTGCASVSWACVAACRARTAAPLCPPHHPSEPNPKAQADAVQDTSLPGDLAGRRAAGRLLHAERLPAPRTRGAGPVQGSHARGGRGRHLAARRSVARASARQLVGAVRRRAAQPPAAAGRHRQPEHCPGRRAPACRAGGRGQQPRRAVPHAGQHGRRHALAQRRGAGELSRLQQQAATGNQSIAQAAARLRAAQAAVASSQAGLFPTLGSTAGATRSRSGGASGASGTGGNTGSSGSSGNISTNYSLCLYASWELDLWGRVSGTGSASQASAPASSDDLAAARLSAQASITQTYFSLRAADASVRLLQETLQSYEQSLKLTNNRYRAGVASSADVAQAEAQYKSTQAQLIEAQTSRAQLEHALAALLGRSEEHTSELQSPCNLVC